MMPWKDQLRLGWTAARWVLWSPLLVAWANAANWVVAAAMVTAISSQVWLGALAGFFLLGAISFAGRKGRD
jgi:hypothetical protein